MLNFCLHLQTCSRTLLLLLLLLLLLQLLLPHLCTMLAGTSQRFTPVGLTLTRSRLGVSGVT
jgi:hypothetical protein